ncbi:MAG: signal peptidase I [Lachnospiraceae bacterium]|nr:signal peptidase I [Lachnospiraceae bacterium]
MRKKKEKAGRRRFLGKYDGLKYGWLQDAKKFILLLAVLFLLFHNVIGFSIVKGGSMEPTLYEGDVVLYTRLNPQYRRGDVISVRIPSGEYYVKRIIAVAGDTVDLREGEVYVNGELLDEPYCPGETRAAEGGIVRYPYTVQEGQIFVMGDNRVSSMDSRSFGAVGTRQIKGKIWFRAGWIYLNRIQDGQ